MQIEPITNVTAIKVKEIAGHDEVNSPVAYITLTNTDGKDFSRIITLWALDSLNALTQDVEVFDVELMYYNKDDSVVQDVIITDK